MQKQNKPLIKLIKKNFIARNGPALPLLFLLLILACSLFSGFPAYGNGQPRRVCIFFDDGWKNQYDVALPILIEFGFKATFSIITDYIGIDRGTFWSRMNIDEIRMLYNLGMEIASHSRTHPHMKNLTREQLIDEIINSKNILMSLGFDVKTFVYPYGEYNSTIIDFVREAGYVAARTISYQSYNTKNLEDIYTIGSFSITNQSFEEFIRILSEASSDTIVVLTYHFISDTGPSETSTPTQNFYKQMKYLKDNNFEVILLSDIISSKRSETFTPSAPTLLDAAGRPVASVARNTAFYVQVTLKSNVGVDLSPIIIVQVKDATGRNVALGTTLADIRAGATKNVPVAFLGVPAGTYTATIYVWSSLTTPTPLAPPTTLTITVT